MHCVVLGRDGDVGEVGRSTQGGDGKELGRFMELGSYYVCVWRVVYWGRVGPSSCYHRRAGYFSRTSNKTLSVSTQLLQGKFANCMSWKQPDYLLYLWNKGPTRRGMSPWKSHALNSFINFAGKHLTQTWPDPRREQLFSTRSLSMKGWIDWLTFLVFKCHCSWWIIECLFFRVTDCWDQ